jgi:hypothetical protein
MSRSLFGCALAGVLAMSTGIAAQDKPTTQYPTNPPSSTAQRPAASDQAAGTVTVEGCLVREQDVPGRKPNVAERAGVMEDYILTSAKVIKGSAPKSAAAAPKAGEPTGTSGSASSMFDVKGIADERLKEFAGKRVQIEGKFDDLDRSASAKTGEDLVNIQGTVIRAATGECPTK